MALNRVIKNIAGNAATATLAENVTNALGNNQTWNIFTAVTRAFGTTYTNSTGKPICVFAVCWAMGSVGLNAYVNGVLIGLELSGGAGYSQEPTVNFIVPNGSTYSVTCGGSWISWSELR